MTRRCTWSACSPGGRWATRPTQRSRPRPSWPVGGTSSPRWPTSSSRARQRRWWARVWRRSTLWPPTTVTPACWPRATPGSTASGAPSPPASVVSAWWSTPRRPRSHSRSPAWASPGRAPWSPRAMPAARRGPRRRSPARRAPRCCVALRRRPRTSAPRSQPSAPTTARWPSPPAWGSRGRRSTGSTVSPPWRRAASITGRSWSSLTTRPPQSGPRPARRAGRSTRSCTGGG